MTNPIYPVNRNARISSNYGMRWGRMHNGTDFAVPTGTAVKAVQDAIVEQVGNRPQNSGLYVVLRHTSDGYYSNYFHLSKQLVKVGQRVKQGDVIALSGNTGSSTGPHLHFEVTKGLYRNYINPLDYLKTDTTLSGVSLVKYESAHFIPNTTQNVREAPNTTSKVVAQYKKGQRIPYDRVYEGNGYRWISYIAKSGKRRYVAYRKLNGKSWGKFV